MPERTWSPAAPTRAIAEIEAHFARHFGTAATVLHELVSDLVHVDVHVIPPRPERNCWTLFTTGMSDLPMTPPEDAADCRFAELMISLPAGWPVDLACAITPPADLEGWYWPIHWLEALARFPHEIDTWLWFGHTIPNGDPPEPFAPDTKLCAWWLLPPIGVGEEARVVRLADGSTISLFHLHALHLDELRLKLDAGSDALLDAFDRAGVREILDPRRRSCARRKLFGLF